MKKRVLVVEDDPFITDISSTKLTEHGYEVRVVENGARALDALNEAVFDVVILDLDLPDISGYEVLKVIRNSDAQKDLPVIIFSNKDDEQLKQEISKLGVLGYFVKASTEFSELFKIIDAL